MKRLVSIRNAHARLHVPRAALAEAIRLLDREFELLAGDLAHLTLPPARLAALTAKIEHKKSKFPGGCPPGELSLVFLTDPALARIHGDFMGDPTATDVITFEGDGAAGLAGEICVSADTAARYVGLAEGPRPRGPGGSHARTRPAGTRALQQAFAAELTLYVVHGWLHLAGYDDLHPARKRRMRAAERRALALLRAARAAPAFRWV